MKQFGEKIPLGWINFITIISGIATVLSTAISVILLFGDANQANSNILYRITIGCLIVFCIVLLLRVQKYQKIAIARMLTSEEYHKLTHKTRDLFFDTIHAYKLDQLSIETLTLLYANKLSCILDLLCDILKKHTTKDICACIKLIEYTNSEEMIDVDTAKLETFCRSVHSSTNRNEYEKSCEIKLSENTDFMEIIDENVQKNYFFQPSLSIYAKSLEKQNRQYKNTNVNWSQYYEGVIVVPIRIETKKLAHIKRNNSYHIIGFLCVDSESKDAFSIKHEAYYVEIVKAFADIIYIVLSQYKHYLHKLKAKSIEENKYESN